MTVAKWKERNSTINLPIGPKEPKLVVFTIEEEAVIIAFSRHTLQPMNLSLTRSPLHRCLPRPGVSHLLEIGGAKPAKKKCKRYLIGYFHIDIAEVQTAVRSSLPGERHRV